MEPTRTGRRGSPLPYVGGLLVVAGILLSRPASIFASGLGPGSLKIATALGADLLRLGVLVGFGLVAIGLYRNRHRSRRAREVRR